jgi:hypothetical protein
LSFWGLRDFVLDEWFFCCAHDFPARSPSGFGCGFVALSVSALHAERVKPGNFFALVRELLSLAQRK